MANEKKVENAEEKRKAYEGKMRKRQGEKEEAKKRRRLKEEKGQKRKGEGIEDMEAQAADSGVSVAGAATSTSSSSRGGDITGLGIGETSGLGTGETSVQHGCSAKHSMCLGGVGPDLMKARASRETRFHDWRGH